MKSFSFILKTYAVAAILAVSLPLSAKVTLDFNVTAPAFTAVATTSSSLTVRQTPSTAAARSINDETRFMDFEYPQSSAFWSKAKRLTRSQHLCEFSGTAVVVEKRPQWLKLSGIGPQYSDGWVLSKYCKVKNIEAVTPTTEAPGLLHLEGDYVLKMDINDSELDGYACIYVGKIADGKIVCPYVVEIDKYYNTLEEEDHIPDVELVFDRERKGYILKFSKGLFERYGFRQDEYGWVGNGRTSWDCFYELVDMLLYNKELMRYVMEKVAPSVLNYAEKVKYSDAVFYLVNGVLYRM